MKKALNRGFEASEVANQYWMNRKTLTKDISIIKLIESFETKYGTCSFKIKDYWEADLCAIGFTDIAETSLVYVSTFGKQRGRFDVHLDFILADSKIPYRSGEQLSNITRQELEVIFKKYLRI